MPFGALVFRSMINCFDAVSVRIEHEGSIIVGVIERAEARLAVARPAAINRCVVKSDYRLSICGLETQMHSDRRSNRHVIRDGELDSQWHTTDTIIRPSLEVG